MRGQRSKATIAARGRRGRICLDSDKGDIVDVEVLQLYGFLNEVAVLVADVVELLCRDSHVEGLSGDVAVTGGLEPRLKRLAIDLLFERTQDAYPLV